MVLLQITQVDVKIWDSRANGPKLEMGNILLWWPYKLLFSIFTKESRLNARIGRCRFSSYNAITCRMQSCTVTGLHVYLLQIESHWGKTVHTSDITAYSQKPFSCTYIKMVMMMMMWWWNFRKRTHRGGSVNLAGAAWIYVCTFSPLLFLDTF